MTRKQALRIGPVMVAYANGAEVECKEVAIIGKDVWHSPPDPDNPSFAPSAEWRMKNFCSNKRTA